MKAIDDFYGRATLTHGEAGDAAAFAHRRGIDATVDFASGVARLRGPTWFLMLVETARGIARSYDGGSSVDTALESMFELGEFNVDAIEVVYRLGGCAAIEALIDSCIDRVAEKFRTPAQRAVVRRLTEGTPLERKR